MTRTIEEAFNEWMRRYIDNPQEFDREWSTVAAFVQADKDGVEPDYGSICASYLYKLMDGDE